MQSHNFFNAKTLSQRNLLSIKTKEITTKHLLRTIAYEAYSEKAAYKKLTDYTESTHFEYDKFGILTKTDKPDCYSLYLYHKPTRNNSAAPKKQVLSLYVDNNDEIVCDNIDDLHRAILLHNKDSHIVPVDLTKSIKYKTMVEATQTNPFPHDHFIYLSFINTEKNLDTPHIFKEHIPKIKKYFNQNQDASFQLLRFYTPEKMHKKLKRAAKKYDLKSKLSSGKIYLLFDAHCTEGSDHLSSEHINSDGEKQDFQYSMDNLITIMQGLHIPKTAELDIDVYACLAAKASEESPSFVQQFSDALRENGYTNFTVKGNTNTVYGIYKPYPKQVISQSPINVHVYGEIREPLTSIEKLKNTEPYLRIMGLNKDNPDIRYRKHTIGALQKRANKICKDAEKDIAFQEAYEELKQHCDSFIAFDHLVTKIIEENPIDQEKNADRKEALKHLYNIIERQYRLRSVSFDFENAYQYLSESYAAFKESSDSLQLNSFRPM